MINLELSNDEAWTVLWALRDRYMADGEMLELPHLHDCMAVLSEERRTEIEGLVAKFPEHMRQAWDTRIAEHQAGVA